MYKKQSGEFEMDSLYHSVLEVLRGLLEKYPTVFFYANTWWIII